MIETVRMRLIPATAELVRAETRDRREFEGLLGAQVPENWPPETVRDALPALLDRLEAAPDDAGWYAWYGLVAADVAGLPVLVASGGFKGPPQGGEIEIGYAVLPQYQGQGYATELVGGLVWWAEAQAGVDRIVAETEWANPASVRVLEKTGFVRNGETGSLGDARFARVRER